MSPIVSTLSPQVIRQRVEHMVWSFSRLRAYESCPEMFYRNYILRQPSEENAFSQYGTFAHSIYERFLRGDLLPFECGTAFRREYALYVTEDFPSFGGRSLEESWFAAGEKAFDSVEDVPEHYEIVGVEIKVKSSIRCGDHTLPFNGFIDLLLRDKRDGMYLIVDHKSHAKFKSAKEKMEYARQLYLYAQLLVNAGIVTEGEIKALVFNMFRAGYQEVIRYDPKQAVEALQWASSLYERLLVDPYFIQCTLRDNNTSVPMFCKEICSFRNQCDTYVVKPGKEVRPHENRT